jgi:hypothetical protein
VRQLLRSAESLLPSISPNEQFRWGNNLDVPAEYLDHKNRYEDLVTAAIQEYAWAGCFSDAGRLLDSNRVHGEGIRRGSERGTVQALVSYGMDDRAFAFAFNGPSGDSQEATLQAIIDESVTQGHLEDSVFYIQHLRVSNGIALYGPLDRALTAPRAARVDKIELALLSRPDIVHLGVGGYLRLAQVNLRLGDRGASIAALAKAKELVSATDFKPNFDWWVYPWRTMGVLQARLDPGAVDSWLHDVKVMDPGQRASFLLGAIGGAWRAPEASQWLTALAALAAEHPTDTSNCAVAEAHAFLGEYRIALDVGKAHPCYQQDENANLASVVRVATLRRDFTAIDRLIPGSYLSGDNARAPLGAAVVGYAIARRYPEALAMMQEMGSYKPGMNEHDVIYALTDYAPADFPYEQFKQEFLRDQDALRIEKAVWLLSLYASCARVKGLDAAIQLTSGLSGEDLAVAEIGIAKGMRGLRFPTRAYPLPDMDFADGY